MCNIPLTPNSCHKEQTSQTDVRWFVPELWHFPYQTHVCLRPRDTAGCNHSFKHLTAPSAVPLDLTRWPSGDPELPPPTSYNFGTRGGPIRENHHMPVPDHAARTSIRQRTPGHKVSGKENKGCWGTLWGAEGRCAGDTLWGDISGTSGPCQSRNSKEQQQEKK